MSDQHTYDVIIVGGGHNGLAAALHLADSGLSVALVEQHEQVGGLALAAEPQPGYRHSPHANVLQFTDLMPRAVAPDTLGVSVVQPEAQLGVAFADGRPPVILHRPDLLPLTRASLAAYSAEDARTYVRLKSRSAALSSLLQDSLYAPPDPAWMERQRSTIARTFKGMLPGSASGRATAQSLIDTLFRTPEIRLLLYVLAIETGVDLHETGSDLAFLGYSIWIAGRWTLPLGRMESYVHALHRVAISVGVDFILSSRAVRVLLDGNQAVGVETADGTFRAARAVVFAAPILQLFDEMLPADSISPTERASLSAFRAQQSTTIGSAAFRLHRPPSYLSARHDGQINHCLKTAVGFTSPADVLANLADVRSGRLARPAGIVRVHSLWDRSMAPPGEHLGEAESSFAAGQRLDEATWQMVANMYPEAFAEMWRGHLINGSDLMPFEASFNRSNGVERRMLMRMGADQYRTSVSRLYLAGPGIFPGGGIHGAGGRNAAAIVLKDLFSSDN
ncbi:phytoene desaturase family protein [Sphingomonas sp. Root710]|uniref:phytoene desaturase family protein n=1 Tax=Sphingomonas sp. Root710 TaxID=1736594 RepID=UPI00138EF5A3|nr:FAD-dependent oxidoreductase [Sphingomonas sp. Root710]